MAQSARLVRWLIAGAAGAAVVAASVAAVLPTLAAMSPHATHVVSSISALQSALGSAMPGDAIQLADGTYTDFSCTNTTHCIRKGDTIRILRGMR